MMNQGVALNTEKEISVEERVHKLSIIMKKAEQGDLKAIALLEQIDTLTK
ncbi:hypothetical protein [Bacillus paranthracis]|uniref:Uncharacterized protein n=1 Tax=Bacillus paranthracis TaxID=2026186 RepID=A0AAJ1K750_9BACI|nr:hypothetical protein [Bacillus paranthracis]MDG0950030.1 hypothetical protein [Bacillus paranthracis]MDG0955927.1 hypothetical protein [Bacillus paranthracis]